ncbi:MAG: glycosyltransferase family A protein [Bacteroidota bacterium]
MTKNKPLISVIIPVYNGERYLREAIESVIAQTWQTIEIIVVDDGSTDDSAAIARRYSEPVHYYPQQHGGFCSAMNHGITSAKGDFFSFLDADDLWALNKLQLQMDSFEESPGTDIVFGHVKQFFSSDIDQNLRKRYWIPSEILPGYIHGAMLIKRDSFLKAGYFDSPWERGPFIHWYARAQQKGLTSIMLPDIVLMRRIHNTNMGITGSGSRADFCHILKEVLDRRRKNT